MAPSAVTYSGSMTPGNRKNQTKTKRPIASKSSKSESTVGVYLRLRPIKLDDPTIVKINEQEVRTVPPHHSTSSQQVYSFTKVFDNAPQSEIFDCVARPVVEDFLSFSAGRDKDEPKDGLIFTYGITGSGKTYTMEGLKTDPGLIYRTIDFLFNSIGAQQTRKNLIENDGRNFYQIQEQEQLYPNLRRADTASAIPSVIKWQNRAKESAHVSVDPNAYYCLFISLIELYNKQVHDLFEDFDSNTGRRKEIRTDSRDRSYVANAVEIEVKSADEAVEYYTRGIKRRKTGATRLNQESSRGHCVLTLKLVQVKKSFDNEFDQETLKSSQLCLVDLAGSERAKRSGARGEALYEAGNINTSLGALRKCIRALRDREPTNNISYREDNLIRLFQSYFEGHGSVCMILCVKPTPEDFQENNFAMEFGILTRDVAVDFASPPKMLKRSRSRAKDANFAQMYEYLDRKISHYEPNPELTDEEFLQTWITRLKTKRDKRKGDIELVVGLQDKVRDNILKTMDDNLTLAQQYETSVKEIRTKDKALELLDSKLNSTERSRDHISEKVKTLQRQIRDLDFKARKAREINQQFELQQAQNEKLYYDILNLLKTEQNRSDAVRRVAQLLKKMKPDQWTSTEPSAPEMEPLQSSSPIDVPNPSTSETAESQTPPTTTNTSSEAMVFHEVHRSPQKNLMASPTTLAGHGRGVPIVNPRYRSFSCSSMHHIHHKPKGTIDTGTVFSPNLKKGRSVKNLKEGDLFRKGATGYSVVHQDADSDGGVETMIYNGRIIPTFCDGAQVIFDDIETMRQVSPKRTRAASDAHCTR